MPKISSFRWKGKIVSEKVYKKRLQQQQMYEKLNVEKVETENQDSDLSEDEEKPEPRDPCDGRRIVDLKFLGQQLWCVSCKGALSLEYIENERRRGLVSLLSVRCHRCLIINEVTTEKQQPNNDKRILRFDVNYKAVLGALQSGLGRTHLQKLFSTMNMPYFDFKTFKTHEEELGLTAICSKRTLQECSSAGKN